MHFLAGEPIKIRAGQGSAGGDGISKGIVEVAGNNSLIAIRQGSHVAVTVRMVVSMRKAHRGAIGAGQQPTNAASAIEGSAQIGPARVSDFRNVEAIALLDDQVAIVHIAHLGRENPIAVLPGVFLADAPAQLAVVNIRTHPRARFCDADELVLVVVLKHPAAIGPKVPVLVVKERHRGGQVTGNGVGVTAAQAVLPNGSLTVAGTTTSGATNVTVDANGGGASNAIRYADAIFAVFRPTHAYRRHTLVATF